MQNSQFTKDRRLMADGLLLKPCLHITYDSHL